MNPEGKIDTGGDPVSGELMRHRNIARERYSRGETKRCTGQGKSCTPRWFLPEGRDGSSKKRENGVKGHSASAVEGCAETMRGKRVLLKRPGKIENVTGAPTS